MYCQKEKVRVENCNKTECEHFRICEENLKNLAVIMKSSKENKLWDVENLD